MTPDAFHHLDAVARHLPFAVDDYGKANDAFSLWRKEATEETRKVVDLWVYCYVQRYFTYRFINERGAPSDVEQCISRAVKRCQKAYESVEKPDRFASYVSVVCKRTLLNHRRSRRELVEVTEYTAMTEPQQMATDDMAVVLYVLELAISAMPKAIREIARLRYVEQLGYEEIAARTGVAIATVRTYAARAVARFREDPGVRALHYVDVLPPERLPDT